MPRRDARPMLTFMLLLLLALAAAFSGACASTAAPSPAAQAPARQAGTCTTNQECASNELCARFHDSCGDRGKCEKRPADCAERGKLLVRPVCGCDQKTYDNACLAAAAGVSVKSEGACAPAPTAKSDFELDHVWVVTAPGAPERTALERAGLHIAPTVNRHDGQGTASITVEFENTFLELIWPDDTVPVAPERETAAYKFRQKSNWRTTGWSPFGIGIRRTPQAPDKLPFTTWSVRSDWMPPGAALEIITPRENSLAPSIWVVPRVMAVAEGSPADAARAKDIDHPSGARRLTALRLVEPPREDPENPTTILTRLGLAKVERGDAWLLELTFDKGAKGQVRDLRPDLPVVLRY